MCDGMCSSGSCELAQLAGKACGMPQAKSGDQGAPLRLLTLIQAAVTTPDSSHEDEAPPPNAA